MKEEKATFIKGVDNICDHFGFGEKFFFELIKTGCPHTRIGKKKIYVIVIKKVEEFLEMRVSP